MVARELVGTVCPKDETDETVLSVSANTSVAVTGAPICQLVTVRDDETLTIGNQGFECDFSCGEHWDDDFTNAPNDLVGTVRMAFTKAQNFGAPPAIGVEASYFLPSQPALATSFSRHFSAGDYVLHVTIREVMVGTPP